VAEIQKELTRQQVRFKY